MAGLLILGELQPDIKPRDITLIIDEARVCVPAVDHVLAGGGGLLHRGGNLTRLVQEFCEAGIESLAMGETAVAREAGRQLLHGELPALRPINFPPGAPGRGLLRVGRPPDGFWLLALGTGNDRQPLDDPDQAITQALASLDDAAPVVILCHGRDLPLKKALIWRTTGLSRPVHWFGYGLGLPTADLALENGRAAATDVGVIGEPGLIDGSPPEIWWLHHRERRTAARTTPPRPVRADAVHLTLDGNGRATVATRLVLGPGKPA